MDRADFQAQADRLLRSIPGLGERRLDELRASISHWCQAPTVLPATFTKNMYNLCWDLALNVGGRVPDSRKKRKPPKKRREGLVQFGYSDVSYPPPQSSEFRFIDLFAGIGGFRQAFQAAGGKCVFSSEWDKYAKLTYEHNYGEYPYGDIRGIEKGKIPGHDVLCAGFPCQPFSLAGLSKKRSLGRKHGFEDETQGTLFFEIKQILRSKRPKAFVLENVKNLLSHNGGVTFEVIRRTLRDRLGYLIRWMVVDGAKWVPQHRERVIMVGYDPKRISIREDEILIPIAPLAGYDYPELASIIRSRVSGKHTLGKGTWEALRRHKAAHAAAGNGFGYGMHRRPFWDGQVTRTISARYHKDGAEILIERSGMRPRRLAVPEAMQLQGFDPDRFEFPVSDTQAYRQIGNSVVVPAMVDCAREVARVLRERQK